VRGPAAVGRFARRARALPLFAPKQAIDLSPGPQCARIDVQIAEGHTRVSVDCLLLSLKHIVILIIHAAPLVDVSALNIASEIAVACGTRRSVAASCVRCCRESRALISKIR
jgi:hypothetical protein